MSHFSESTVELAALAWLEAEGWLVLYGPEIAPGEPDSERTDYRDSPFLKPTFGSTVKFRHFT